MYAIPEQLTSMNKGAVQAWLEFTHLTADSTERLVDFQFRSSRAALAESLDALRALTGAKDVQEITQIVTTAAQPAADRSSAYARHMHALVTEVQKEYTRFFDGRVADVNQGISGMIEQLAQNAPAGSEVAVAALKSALSAANQAYDVASKTGKQITEVTEATLQAAPFAGGKKKAA